MAKALFCCTEFCSEENRDGAIPCATPAWCQLLSQPAHLSPLELLIPVVPKPTGAAAGGEGTVPDGAGAARTLLTQWQCLVIHVETQGEAGALCKALCRASLWLSCHPTQCKAAAGLGMRRFAWRFLVLGCGIFPVFCNAGGCWEQMLSTAGSSLPGENFSRQSQTLSHYHGL